MRSWTDEDLEVKIGRLLRWGILAAAMVMLAGGCAYLVRYGSAHADYRSFQASAEWPPGSGVIGMAVLLIVATPVARVGFAAYAFLRERDWRYVAVSLTVLALLAGALLRAA